MRFASGEKPRWPTEKAAEVQEIVGRYPVARSAIMPLLHLAQEERGHVAHEDILAIADILDLTPAYVESTASFYSMYHPHPVGKYVIVVCTNIACNLAGGERVLDRFEKALGVKNGETSADGLFTLEGTHECIAACDAGPCAQVNVEYFLRLNEEKVDQIAAALKAGDEAALKQLAEHPESAMAILGREEAAAPAQAAAPATTAAPAEGGKADGV